MTEHLFDTAPPERAKVHACTGPGCAFCEFVDGSKAKTRATEAVIYDPRWVYEATEWRRGVLGQWVTADDLVDQIGLPDRHPNQIGALFRQWAAFGLIERTGSTQSRRDSNHARTISVWKVLA